MMIGAQRFVGINNTVPTCALDVDGQGIFSGNLFSNNFQATGQILGTTLIVTTGITSGSVNSTNGSITNITTSSLVATNVSTTNITSNSLVATNLSTTNITSSSIRTTNITSSSLVATNVSSSNITTSSLIATNITVSTLLGGVSAVGTLNVNASSTIANAMLLRGAAVSTGVSVQHIKQPMVRMIRDFNPGVQNGCSGDIRFGAAQSADNESGGIEFALNDGAIAGNSFGSVANNVVMFLSGSGKIGVLNTTPTHALDITGGLRTTTGITTNSLLSSNVNTTHVTTTNAVITNLTCGTLNIAGFAPTNVNTTNLTTSNAVITNLPCANINISGGLVSPTNVNATNLTTNNAVIKNETTSNVLVTNTFRATGNSNTLGSLFTTGGNVGIGISPTQLLHLQKSGTDNYIKVDAGGTLTNYSGIMMTEFNNNYGWSLRQNATTDLLHISTINNTFTDVVTFDRNGNIGIGTTTPNVQMDVASGTLRVRGLTTGITSGSGIESTYNNSTGNIYSYDRGLSRYGQLNLNDVIQLTTAGNVGIGITSPTSKLQVTGSLAASSVSTASLITTSITIGTLRTTNAVDLIGGTLRVANNGSTSQFIINLGSSGVGSFRSGYINGDGTSIELNNQQNGDLIFSANNGERMRIRANGEIRTSSKVCINTTTFDAMLEIKLNSNSTNAVRFVDADSAVMGSIYRNSFGGTFYATTSDVRAKEEISDYQESVIEKIKKVKTKKYKYNGEEGESYGFIAHELHREIPSVVKGQVDAVDEQGKPVLQQVSYGALTPFLWKAMSELIERVEKFELKVK